MRRINPDTNKPFQQGDKRPSTDKQDGKVFFNYRGKTEISTKTGYVLENWCLPEEIEIKKERTKKLGRISANKRYAKKRAEYEASDTYKKKMEWFYSEIDVTKLERRTNADGKRFSKGDMENGKYFIKYLTDRFKYSTRRTELGKSIKYFDEVWGTEEEFLNQKFRFVANSKRASYGSELDAEYLKSIFPKDRKCPITRKRFVYTKKHDDSPELDRINPKLGYIKGNVVWISSRMNRLKNDITQEELLRLSQYMTAYSSISSSQRKELIEKFTTNMDEANIREGNTGIGE